VKPSLTPELLARLVSALELGDMSVTEVAEKAGVRAATLRVWLSLGARAPHLLTQLVQCACLARARAVGVERAARSAALAVIAAPAEGRH
jgi:hypothetical protein